jgi:putative Holliday junction resolvase
VPRILGIDYGLRRIGLALSDPTATIASPLPTLTRRRGKRPPVQAVAEIAREHEVAEAVLGLPLNLQGDEDEWTAEVRAFGAALADRAGIPVRYLDERFTSARAERSVRALGLKKSEREDKARIDAAAATLILQAFLDRRDDG